MSVHLIHYGEVGLKKGNRNLFIERLVDNIRIAFHPNQVRIRKMRGRIILDAMPIEDEKTREILGRVFGIVNFAPAIVVEPSIESIKNAALELSKKEEFKTFGIAARRANKAFPMNSCEINKDVGAAVQKASKAGVHLDNPDLLIGVEVLEKEAIVCSNKIKGPGGLPCNEAEKVLCMLSGGIDSPVAAWRMMKRGCYPLFIHFHLAPFVSMASVDKVLTIAEKLLRNQRSSRITLVPFGAIQQKIVTQCPPDYRVIFYRRFMMRIAEQVAIRNRAYAIVTGEALAQVASQTLLNLVAIEQAVSMPVLRPLIGLDKEEIMAEARAIDTYDLSIQPHDDCCSFLTPLHPVTKAKIAQVVELEQVLDVKGLVEEALDGASQQPIG